MLRRYTRFCVFHIHQQVKALLKLVIRIFCLTFKASVCKRSRTENAFAILILFAYFLASIKVVVHESSDNNSKLYTYGV